MKRLDNPPCRVSYVDTDRVRVDDTDRASRDAIAQAGLKLERRWIGPDEVRFEGPGEVGNPAFERTMLALHRAGLAFQEDYKTVSAADLMRDLQAKGSLVGAFKAVGYDGEYWIVRENAPGFVPSDPDDFR